MNALMGFMNQNLLRGFGAKQICELKMDLGWLGPRREQLSSLIGTSRWKGRTENEIKSLKKHLLVVGPASICQARNQWEQGGKEVRP